MRTQSHALTALSGETLTLRAELDECIRIIRRLFDPYHPERHYMRGPGPKWLAKDAEHGHIAGMSKSPRVTFKMERIAEGDWQIVADYPGVEPRYIKGFKSKAEIDEWLQGSRRIDWLRSQGYAK